MGRPGSPDSTHQRPDHDSDHAQRSHDGEDDKATLEKIHPDTPCSQGRHVSNVNYGSGFRVRKSAIAVG